jgi:hypothetical protein
MSSELSVTSLVKETFAREKPDIRRVKRDEIELPPAAPGVNILQ